MTKNLLVTGIDGFIGSSFVVQAKANNFHVYGLNRKSDAWDAEIYKKHLSMITRDIKFESVIHFGAIATTSIGSEENILGFNVEAVKILAKFCSDTDTPLLFISSAAVYGNKSNFLSMYAKSKIQGEKILNENPNLQFLILRLFNTYGFNETSKFDMKSVISDMIVSGHKYKKVFIWKFKHMKFGHQSRDFIYVQDVVHTIISIIHSKRYFRETLDLGSGQSYKFIDLANFIVSIETEWLIEAVNPPDSYLKNSYQQYTCAKAEWIPTSIDLIKPRHPFEIIPSLIKKYKTIAN